MRLFTTCLLCALALPATAQIYKYTDAHGNTAFTNQPLNSQNPKAVSLPPTNTMQAQQPATEPEASGPPYRTLALSNFPTEQTLRVNNGTFSVSVHLEPRLRPGHSLRLVLDGQPYGQPSNVPRLQVVNADRGEHSLAVEVLNAGQQLQKSAPVTFTIQRVNTNSPALKHPVPKPKTVP